MKNHAAWVWVWALTTIHRPYTMKKKLKTKIWDFSLYSPKSRGLSRSQNRSHIMLLRFQNEKNDAAPVLASTPIRWPIEN
jgi:hypothetical protein